MAQKQGVAALEYRKGDLEAVPIADGTVDLALFSQSLHHALHPERAIAEAWRILKPGGRIAILDLVQHRFTEARELYADVWLGFSEVELELLLGKSGFGNVHTAVVHKETEAPFFQTRAGHRQQGSGIGARDLERVAPRSPMRTWAETCASSFDRFSWRHQQKSGIINREISPSGHSVWGAQTQTRFPDCRPDQQFSYVPHPNDSQSASHRCR